MEPREFRETFPQGHPFAESHVTGDIIHNVALLGAASLNNRTYSTQAMKDAVSLYSGVPVYVDHPTESEMRDRGGRSVLDLAGRVLNPRLVGTQVRGDIQVLEREPTKSLFLALAKQMPEVAGMSHRARGDIEVDDDGHETVTSLTHVFAVELVAEPATVAGLFESITKEPRDLRSLNEQGRISFEDISQRVRTALTLAENPGDDWLHIEALFDDRVIYQIDSGPMWRRSWEMDGAGSVMLGDVRIEVQKVTTFEPVTGEPQENQEMEIKDLTVDQLKEQRPDLLKELREQDTAGQELEDLKARNKDLAKKVDDAEVYEAARARGELIEVKLKGAKLLEADVTELFRKNLAEAEDEAGVDALIADRKAVVDGAAKRSGPVLPERDLTAALTIEDNGKFKDVDEGAFGRAYDMFA